MSEFLDAAYALRGPLLLIVSVTTVAFAYEWHILKHTRPKRSRRRR